MMFCMFDGFAANAILLRLYAEDVADICDLMFLFTVLVFAAMITTAVRTRALTRACTAFTVGFDERQSFLAALEAAARKIRYRLQSPTRDELQIQLKPSEWLLGLSFPDITVTFTGSADRSAAVIAGPALLVSRLQERFPGAVQQPSPGSLRVPWRRLLIFVLMFVAVWAILMGLIALTFGSKRSTATAGVTEQLLRIAEAKISWAGAL
jgi:hypothetical protein